MTDFWKGTAKKLISLLLCGALLLPLSGCGGRELYERLLIHGIGVDVDGDNFVVTVRSSISPADEGEEYFRCEGASVLEAMNSLSRSTGRRPFYAHNYLVVFGEDCAERGLDRCLDFFIRYYNTRPAVRMYLAEGRAEEILSARINGKYLKMSQLQQLSEAGKDNGCTVGVDLLEFLNAVKRQGSSPVLPVLRKTDEKVEISSTAYFDGYALKGFLSLSETRGYLAAKNKLQGGEAALFGTFGGATLSLSGAEGRITAGVESDRPAFLIDVKVRADVSAINGGRSKLETGFYDDLEEALAETIQEEILAAVSRTVKEDRCDIFGFGALLYRTDPKSWEALSDSWKDVMAECRYEVAVSASVARLEQEQLSQDRST